MDSEAKAGLWDNFKSTVTQPFSDAGRLIVDSVSPDPEVRANAQSKVLQSLALPSALVVAAIILSPLVAVIGFAAMLGGAAKVAIDRTHQSSGNSREVYPVQSGSSTTGDVKKSTPKERWVNPFLFSPKKKTKTADNTQEKSVSHESNKSTTNKY